MMWQTALLWECSWPTQVNSNTWVIFKKLHPGCLEIASNFSLQRLVPSWGQKWESLPCCHQILGMQEPNLWPRYEALKNCYEDKQEIKIIFFSPRQWLLHIDSLLPWWTHFLTSSCKGAGERSHFTLTGTWSQLESSSLQGCSSRHLKATGSADSAKSLYFNLTSRIAFSAFREFIIFCDWWRKRHKRVETTGKMTLCFFEKYIVFKNFCSQRSS